MTQRLKLLRDALVGQVKVWRERAEQGRAGQKVRVVYHACATDLELLLEKVEEELSARATRGWATRRRNERKRAKAERLAREERGW